MKAIEVKAEGYYWYRHSTNDWVVVYFDGDRDDLYPFSFAGNDQPYCSKDMPGDFVGPLKDPSDDNEADHP